MTRPIAESDEVRALRAAYLTELAVADAKIAEMRKRALAAEEFVDTEGVGLDVTPASLRALCDGAGYVLTVSLARVDGLPVTDDDRVIARALALGWAHDEIAR